MHGYIAGTPSNCHSILDNERLRVTISSFPPVLSSSTSSTQQLQAASQTGEFLFQRHTDDRNGAKEDDEDDGDIEDQALYAAARLKDRSACAAEGAAQTGASRLQQDKNDDGYGQNNLHCLQCRKPVRQMFPRFRISAQ